MQTFRDNGGKALPGPFRIVTGHDDLEIYTRQGWGLVFSYQEERLEQALKLGRLPETQYRARRTVVTSDQRVMTIPEGCEELYEETLVKRQCFVLQEGVEPALARAAEQLKELSSDYSDLSLRNGTALSANATLNEQVAKLTANCDRLEGLRAGALDRALGAERKAEKMERAIGKLREELGAAKMKEILGE
jgi:hypothetical protein